VKRRQFCTLVTLALSGAFAWTGCQTTGGARPITGQLSYRTRDQVGLIGDVVVVPGEPFRLEFTKGPGEPLLRIENSGVFGSASGSLAGPGWSGRVADAPLELQAWFALRPAFKGPNTGAARNPNQPSYTIRRDTEGSDVLGMTVTFIGTGQEFVFRYD